MINKFLGKIAIFSFLLIGLVAVSSPSAYAAFGPKPNTAKATKPATKSKKTVSSAKKSTPADISEEKARAIALKRARGTVEKSELKDNKGRQVYEISIRSQKGQLRDIWVDQKTGHVVRNILEKGK